MKAGYIMVVNHIRVVRRMAPAFRAPVGLQVSQALR